MLDPVILCDGITYERASIQEWLNRGKKTSPLTGMELEHFHLISNIALKSAIEQHLIKK